MTKIERILVLWLAIPWSLPDLGLARSPQPSDRQPTLAAFKPVRASQRCIRQLKSPSPPGKGTLNPALLRPFQEKGLGDAEKLANVECNTPPAGQSTILLSENHRSEKQRSENRRPEIPLKNARLGKITYLSSSRKTNPALERAIFRELIGREYLAERNDLCYIYFNIDLNEDGFQDAILTFNGYLAAGSGGQHFWIFRGTARGYIQIGELLHVWPTILITSNQTRNWKDLIAIPGKLFVWEDSYYKSYRFDGQEYQLHGVLEQGATLSGKAIVQDSCLPLKPR